MGQVVVIRNARVDIHFMQIAIGVLLPMVRVKEGHKFSRESLNK